MTEQPSQQMYFIVRTDVSATSGKQRVFGAYDDESEAVAMGAIIASGHPGQFAIFAGSATLKLECEVGPVKATPVT